MNPQEQCLLIRLLYVMLYECLFEGGQVVWWAQTKGQNDGRSFYQAVFRTGYSQLMQRFPFRFLPTTQQNMPELTAYCYQNVR